jgi:hypothetical protein
MVERTPDRVSRAEICEAEVVEMIMEWADDPSDATTGLAMSVWFSNWSASVDEPERISMVLKLVEFIETHRGEVWNSLLVPLFKSGAAQVRTCAALSLSALHPLVEGDPLTGPRFLLALSLDESLGKDVRAASFAGVLHLGDPRTLPDTLTAWERLPIAVRFEVAQLEPATAPYPYVEFLIQALAKETASGVFGSLAGQLSRLSDWGTKENPFILAERNFPAWAGDGDPFSSYRVMLTPEVRTAIMRDLQQIAKEQATDPVLPYVLERWDIPRPCDMEEFDLSAEGRATRLRGADTKNVLPPQGEPVLALNLNDPTYDLYSELSTEAFRTVLPALVVVREIQSLSFLDRLRKPYVEALAFIAGCAWAGWGGYFAVNAFSEPLASLPSFGTYLLHFRKQWDALKVPNGEIDANIACCAFDRMSKTPEGREHSRRCTDLELFGTAFALGYEIGARAKHLGLPIEVEAHYPHQRMVVLSTMVTAKLCYRFGEMPPLVRLGMSGGLLSGDDFDAATLGRYISDALRVPRLADAPNCAYWAHDAFNVMTEALKDAAYRQRALSGLGAIGLDDIRQLHQELSSGDVLSFGDLFVRYLAKIEVDTPDAIPGARSFDQISLALDFGLWSALVFSADREQVS